MYEEVYSPVPDLDKYLRRIGLEPGSIKPDLDSLGRIIRGHLACIPFENLDAFDKGMTPPLGTEQLFDKMVLHRRGGWCFELNGLLHGLLLGLGYKVYDVGVRVTVGNNPHALILHRGEVVELEGKKYYCDVGFGTLSMPHPIPLSGEETESGFRIEQRGGQCHVYLRKDGQDQYLLRFEDRYYPPEDYIPANFFTSQNIETPFRKRLSISIQKGELRRQLVDSTMKEYISGELVRTVTAADKAELKALLEENFGIEYDFEE